LSSAVGAVALNVGERRTMLVVAGVRVDCCLFPAPIYKREVSLSLLVRVAQERTRRCRERMDKMAILLK
jgi:hypothetical protein